MSTFHFGKLAWFFELAVGSFNTTNSKGSQSNNPEGTKVAKKRAKAGESTRPRPKDRQLIQDRVKELREIVPNGAKVILNHTLFFQFIMFPLTYCLHLLFNQMTLKIMMAERISFLKREKTEIIFCFSKIQEGQKRRNGRSDG